MLSSGDARMTAPSDPAHQASPALQERVVCEHADRCGGCPIIALPYGEQLALKRGRVVQSIARYPALELVYTEPVTAAEYVTLHRCLDEAIAQAVTEYMRRREQALSSLETERVDLVTQRVDEGQDL